MRTSTELLQYIRSKSAGRRTDRSMKIPLGFPILIPYGTMQSEIKYKAVLNRHLP